MKRVLVSIVVLIVVVVCSFRILSSPVRAIRILINQDELERVRSEIDKESLPIDPVDRAAYFRSIAEGEVDNVIVRER